MSETDRHVRETDAALAEALGRLAAAQTALAAAQTALAAAVKRNTCVIEIFLEAMPATAEAKLLGVNPKTIRRRRAQRAAERVL